MLAELLADVRHAQRRLQTTAYLGAMAEAGLLPISRRIEDVIPRDGAILSPAPIEQASRGLAGVRDVAVFPSAGGGAAEIGAALVLEPGADPQAVRAGAAARL